MTEENYPLVEVEELFFDEVLTDEDYATSLTLHQVVQEYGEALQCIKRWCLRKIGG